MGGLGGTSGGGSGGVTQLPSFMGNPVPGSQGGGGGGGGGYNGPGGMTSSVQENPQLQALQGEFKDYQDKLSAGNDQDAINAMQRQRDLSSGMGREFAANAGRRGLGPGSGASQLLMQRNMDSAGRNQVGLNAGLTSDARRQQLTALQGRGSLALGAASANLGQQQFGLSQWQAQQQAQQAQAQLQALQSQQQWQQMMGLFQFMT